MTQQQLDARTPADYAIEHGGYLAQAAEGLLDALNEVSALADLGDPAALDVVNDHRSAVRSAIYEFRKRATRAAAEGKAP